MSLTNDDIQMALRIKKAVTEYFTIHLQESMIEAKELMPIFISKGIYKSNHKDGLPIRQFLRHLEKEHHLHLIPQALFQQKDINKNWYFIRVNN